MARRSRPGLRGTPLITRASSCCGTSRCVLHKSYGFDEVIHTPKLLTLVRTDWRAARPFVDLGRNLHSS